MIAIVWLRKKNHTVFSVSDNLSHSFQTIVPQNCVCVVTKKRIYAIKKAKIPLLVWIGGLAVI